MSQTTELDPLLVNRLRRPELPPKKAAVGPARPRPAVVRMALGIVLGAIAVSFAGRIAGFALEPVFVTYRTGQEIRSLQQVAGSQSATNAQLRQDIAYLNTPAGVEQEARRRGWVKPGEVALSLVVPEEAAESSTPKPSVQQPGRVSISDQIRNAVDTCLAVLGGRRPTR
jgi:cell division protein FtsB